MYSLLTGTWKRAQYVYHQVMHAYHCTLYKDCLDMQMKAHFYRMARHHELKLKSSS